MRIAIAVLALTWVLGAQESPKDRQKAARALAKEGSAGIPKLAPMLQDPDVDVRREAAKSIVAIGGAASLDPLTNSLKDGDEEVQILCTDGLVNFYLPGYRETGLSGTFKRAGTRVMSRWTDQNDQVIPPYVEVRPEVVAGIGKVASGGVSMDARANAARALGILRGRGATEDLVMALKSKDSKVLYEVLVAFEKIRDPETAQSIHYLLRDPDDKVQLAALQTVGLLRNRESVGPIREAYDRARNDKIRRGALEALALIPAEETRSLFEAQVDSTDEGLRAGAAEGIGRLRRAEDQAKMRARFESEIKMRPRLAFAFAAVKLGDHGLDEQGPLRYLMNTVNQKAWKGVAEGYLTELLQDESLRQKVNPEISRGTKQEKLSLAVILGQSGGRDSEGALDALTRDGDADVASEAMRALRSLRARNP